MASRYYGLDKGNDGYPSESASTTSKGLEVVIDLSKNIPRSEFLQMLDFLVNEILVGSTFGATLAQLYFAYRLNQGQPENSVLRAIPVNATGTITLASVLAADTVTIDGTALTAHASITDATRFKVGVSDTADAAALVTSIGLNSTIAAKVSATSSLGVVTITAVVPGTVGNALTLATSNSGRLAKSATTLLGGLETTSGDVQIKVLTIQTFTRQDVANAVEKIKDYVLIGAYPPA